MTDMSIQIAIARADLVVPLIFLILIAGTILAITAMLYGRRKK